VKTRKIQEASDIQNIQNNLKNTNLKKMLKQVLF